MWKLLFDNCFFSLLLTCFRWFGRRQKCGLKTWRLLSGLLLFGCLIEFLLFGPWFFGWLWLIQWFVLAVFLSMKWILLFVMRGFLSRRLILLSGFVLLQSLLFLRFVLA